MNSSIINLDINGLVRLIFTGNLGVLVISIRQKHDLVPVNREEAQEPPEGPDGEGDYGEDGRENLEEGEGLQFFSNDRAEALKLINEYEGINSGATESFQGLGELKEQLAEMEASGISSPDLAADISELPICLNLSLKNISTHFGCAFL